MINDDTLAITVFTPLMVTLFYKAKIDDSETIEIAEHVINDLVKIDGWRDDEKRLHDYVAESLSEIENVFVTLNEEDEDKLSNKPPFQDLEITKELHDYIINVLTMIKNLILPKQFIDVKISHRGELHHIVLIYNDIQG